MQTFLPYPDFIASAQCLDYRRLGKQRLEARQILNILHTTDPKRQTGYIGHPAVLMWKGYEEALSQYLRACINDWVHRGYENNIPVPGLRTDFHYPPWWGGPIHATHRAALLFKLPPYYGQFGWDEKPIVDYYWPTHHENTDND